MTPDNGQRTTDNDAKSIISRVRKPVVLITGAGGEIGHGLIAQLTTSRERGIVTLDVNRLDSEISKSVDVEITGSILEKGILDRILATYKVELVFHLAALLSTRSEFTPVTAHQVNVEGTLNLLEFAQHEAESHGRPVVFIYPSSIAAYGLPDVATKARAGRVKEDEWTHPTTMYGCNKLYCEQLGHYYARHYKQLAADTASGRVDFRCVRFPGLISALTVPSGGTSDYAPEMIHAAAKGEPYACFVRPDTRIPFMAMPDGVEALLTLAAAPRSALTRTAYNVGAFNPSAEQIRDVVIEAFPGARDLLGGRREATRHRGLVAGRRGRQRRAQRLGLRAPLRLQTRLRGVPDPHHPQSNTLNQWLSLRLGDPLRRRRDVRLGFLAGVGTSASLEAADGADVDIVVAEDLARQPDAGGPLGGEHGLLGHGHRVRLSLDELHATGRAPGVAPAGVQDVDLRVLFNGEHQALAILDVYRSKSLDCELRHPPIIAVQAAVTERSSSARLRAASMFGQMLASPT